MTRAGHPRPLVLTMCLFLLCCLSSAPARARDPLVGIEKAIGKQAERAYRAALGGVDDPLLNAWVSRIGAKVAAASGYRDTDVRFVLIDTSISNAYTLPGGRILVTRGLLENVRSDDDLAAILAHEMAHAARRHPRRQVVQAGAALAALHFLKPKDRAARLALTAAAPLAVLAFSRRQETEADRLGLAIAARAGYDPGAQMSFLRRLGEGRFPEWLGTHPSPSKRRARVERELSAGGAAALVEAGQSYARRGLYRQARRQFDSALAADQSHAGARAALDALPPERLPLQPPTDRVAIDPAERDAVRLAARNVRNRLKRANRGAALAGGLQTLALARAVETDAPTLLFSTATYAGTERLHDVLATMYRTASRGPAVLDRLAALPEPADAATREEIRHAVADVRAGEAKVMEAAGMLGLADAALNADWIALQAGVLNADAAWWARYGGVTALGAYAGDRLQAARGRAREAERTMAAARLTAAVLRLDASDAALDADGRSRAWRLTRTWLEGPDTEAGGRSSTSGPSDAYPEPGAPLGRWCLARAAALSAPGKDPADAEPGPLATALEHIVYLLEDEGLAL